LQTNQPTSPFASLKKDQRYAPRGHCGGNGHGVSWRCTIRLPYSAPSSPACAAARCASGRQAASRPVPCRARTPIRVHDSGGRAAWSVRGDAASARVAWAGGTYGPGRAHAPLSFGMLGDASRHSHRFAHGAGAAATSSITFPANVHGGWLWHGALLPRAGYGAAVVRDGRLWDGHKFRTTSSNSARRSMAGYCAREDARS